MEKKKFFTSRNIAFLAVLLALVIVLQVWASAIPIGTTRISLTLIPIVLGAVLLGPLAGAFLGAAFGVVVIVVALTGGDPFTFTLFADHPVLTVALCLVKGAAAGFVAGLIYKAIRRKNEYAAVLTATLAAPADNTGLFILGALLMSDTLSANFVADGTTVMYFLVIGCAGINFIIEFIVNAVASPAIYTVERVIERSVRGRRAARKAPRDAETSSGVGAETAGGGAKKEAQDSKI